MGAVLKLLGGFCRINSSPPDVERCTALATVYPLTGCQIAPLMIIAYIWKTFPLKMLPMNQSEFIAALARHGEMSKGDAEKCYQAFRHTLETELPTAGRITLPGFCTFEIVGKSARKVRNPAAGQEIDVPAKRSIRFKARKDFADKVNH